MAEPSYAPLYTDLEAADASAITEQLDSRGTSYELADGGRTVLVPRKDLYQLRLDMSAAGLPEGGTQGYALLDGPAMPIVRRDGEDEPNDSYIEQLVMGAEAAVEEVVRQGVASRDAIFIGGHSYGAASAPITSCSI